MIGRERESLTKFSSRDPSSNLLLLSLILRSKNCLRRAWVFLRMVEMDNLRLQRLSLRWQKSRKASPYLHTWMRQQSQAPRSVQGSVKVSDKPRVPVLMVQVASLKIGRSRRSISAIWRLWNTKSRRETRRSCFQRRKSRMSTLGSWGLKMTSRSWRIDWLTRTRNHLVRCRVTRSISVTLMRSRSLKTRFSISNKSTVHFRRRCKLDWKLNLARPSTRKTFLRTGWRTRLRSFATSTTKFRCSLDSPQILLVSVRTQKKIGRSALKY